MRMPGVRKSRSATRDEVGATTAEYAVCTGAGVGFAGVLFNLLTSDTGKKVVNTVFESIIGILPF